MARCPECSKFASNEEEDPEVNNVEIDPDGHVTADVRIVNSSACCGSEMTAAGLTLEGDYEDAEYHQGEGHELSVEEGYAERTNKSGPTSITTKTGKVRPIPPRFVKSFYGANVSFTVSCTCQAAGAEPLATLELEDFVAASDMEEQN